MDFLVMGSESRGCRSRQMSYNARKDIMTLVVGFVLHWVVELKSSVGKVTAVDGKRYCHQWDRGFGHEGDNAQFD